MGSKWSREKVDAGKEVCRAFWGGSTGGDADLAAAENSLKGMGASKTDLDRIRQELPAIDETTTVGARIRRMDSVLRRMT